MKLDPIYVIHALALDVDKSSALERILRDRVWFFFHEFENAEKAVLENYTDMHENGYYNYLAIHKVEPGWFMHNKDSAWYAVVKDNTTKNGFDVIKIKYNPIMKDVNHKHKISIGW